MAARPALPLYLSEPGRAVADYGLYLAARPLAPRLPRGDGHPVLVLPGLLADDVSSALDASTEVELWAALRARGTAVLGSTSKWAALAQADRVVVLVDGEVAATGPWSALAPQWGHLAG